jgi:hypothetical protein
MAETIHLSHTGCFRARSTLESFQKLSQRSLLPAGEPRIAFSLNPLGRYRIGAGRATRPSVQQRVRSAQRLRITSQVRNGDRLNSFLQIARRARDSEELEFVQKRSTALFQAVRVFAVERIREKLKRDSAVCSLVLSGGAIAMLLYIVDLVPFASTFFELFGILVTLLVVWKSLHRNIVIDGDKNISKRIDFFVRHLRKIRIR